MPHLPLLICPNLAVTSLLQDDIIVEYDTRSMAPIGLVCMDMPDDCTARLVDAEGRQVDAAATGALAGGLLGGGLPGPCWGVGQGELGALFVLGKCRVQQGPRLGRPPRSQVHAGRVRTTCPPPPLSPAVQTAQRRQRWRS